VDSPEYVTSAEIRAVFIAQASASPTHELAYSDLWALLREQQKRIRGATEKRQRDTVYRALLESNDIERSARGVFRLKAEAT
jgi:hypothetical protein